MSDETTPAPSLIDRALLAVAPGLAASRARSRVMYHAHSTALRTYEGAKKGRRNDGWIRPSTSANAEITSSDQALRDGARQLVRDNGLAANAVNVLTNNTIGTGIRPGFNAATDAGTRMLTELWEEHVEGWGSGSGEIGGVYERQQVGFRSIVEGGSAIYRRRRRSNQSMVLPYAIEVMEPDYLATHLDSVLNDGGGQIISGKEYSRRNELIAAHLYLQHPGDAFRGLRGLSETTRITAPNFSHAFRVDRPGQVTGASWFAPVMTALRELSDTRSNYQLRQKIASCYTAFLYESEPSTSSSATRGKQDTTSHMEPARIESLPPGRDVKFANPPGVEGMSDFDTAQLMTIAVGFGIPFEALSGDLRRVTFLSGRMGWLAFYKNIDAWRTSIVIPRICQREFEWFMESVAIAKGFREPVQVTWTPPLRDLLNPKEEIKALREEIRLGTLSPPDAIRMRGKNPDKVLEEWVAWAKKVDAAEMSFDWDPRKFSAAGNNIEEQIAEAVEEGADA